MTQSLHKTQNFPVSNVTLPVMDSGHKNQTATDAGFPAIRLRRNRQTLWSRNLVAENALSVRDLIWPCFVVEGKNIRQDIPSMPGIQRFSIDHIIGMAKLARSLHIPAIAIFPVTDPDLKTSDGREAVNPNNLICRCVKEVKSAVPDIGVVSDIALDPYTDHGHDGLVENGEIVNDPTLEVLARQALVQADAGVDILAPSDMMDGRVGYIRKTLDENAHQNVQILSYAAKYASAFYGPFRDAVQSKGCLKGDKATYQMDPANRREAIREVEMDVREGADMVMIKPGMPYLDIIRDVKNVFDLPVLAYNVSGEYTMLKLAADQGIVDGEKAMMEMLMCFKRAGADGILSYFSLEAAKILNA